MTEVFSVYPGVRIRDYVDDMKFKSAAKKCEGEGNGEQGFSKVER